MLAATHVLPVFQSVVLNMHLKSEASQKKRPASVIVDSIGGGGLLVLHQLCFVAPPPCLVTLLAHHTSTAWPAVGRDWTGYWLQQLDIKRPVRTASCWGGERSAYPHLHTSHSAQSTETGSRAWKAVESLRTRALHLFFSAVKSIKKSV